MSEFERSPITRRAALSVFGTTVAGAVVAGASGSLGASASASASASATPATTPGYQGDDRERPAPVPAR